MCQRLRRRLGPGGAADVRGPRRGRNARRRSTSLLRLPTVHPVASLVPLARCRWTARIAVWTALAPSTAYAASPRALDRPHRAGPPALVIGPTAPLSTFSNRNSGIEPRPSAIVTAARGLPSSHGKGRQAVTDRLLGRRPWPRLAGWPSAPRASISDGSALQSKTLRLSYGSQAPRYRSARTFTSRRSASRPLPFLCSTIY